MNDALKTSELISQAQKGDKDACEKLILDNSGLVWSIVRRFLGRGIDADDLYQLGCVGFIKAVHGFDESYGTQFSTYAVPKIAGEIKRYLRDDGPIKISRGIKDMSFKLSSARRDLMNTLGREPLLSELSEATGFTAEEIAVCECAAYSVESLQKTTGEDGLTLESTLSTDGIEDNVVERVALRQAVVKLPERERSVIFLRFFKGLTQDRVAKVLNVSQVQVSRIERKALGLLRERIG